MAAIPLPSTYVKLPYGTKLLWGAVDVLLADMKLLKDAVTLGSTGSKSSLVECTRICDDDEQYTTGRNEYDDKEFVFLDDRTDVNLTGLLTAAKNRETVKFRVEYPNGQYNEAAMLLLGWTMNELEKDSPLKLTVYAKQLSNEDGAITV